MIITICGRSGSGKSTIAKLLAKKLKFKHYSSGDLMRKMAKKRGVTLLELSKIAEEEPTIDKELDERQVKLGKRKDDFVIDGRLSAFFIPNATKIFLDANKKERARRILGDLREEERGKDVKEMLGKIERREDSERKRYKNYYGFDCYDKKYYEIVINTTNTNPEEVVNKIVKLIKT